MIELDEFRPESVTLPVPEKKPRKELDPQFSDFNLARSVIESHGSTILYMPKFERGYWWTGDHWQEDITNHIPEVVKNHLHRKSLLVDSSQKRLLLQSRSKVNNVLAFVRMDSEVTTTVDEMDTRDMELNTPAGTYDLRTMTLGKHDPAAKHSMITAVSPSFDPPELFLSHLRRVTDGDTGKQTLIQNFYGSAVSGQQARTMLFQYGEGQNGKGTIANAVAGCMGTYARPVSDEVFAWSKFPSHSTNIAGLKGIRFAYGDETQAGSAWDEAKIKRLTGGGLITAHRMCQDNEDFAPKFKLVVTGNNKPTLTGVDEAIKSRMILLPFTVTIPEKERDGEHGNRLREEYPRILGWLLQGWRNWLRDGLCIPDSVREATNEYLSDEDTLGRWIAERAIVGSKIRYETATSSLFADWKDWCDKSNERAGNINKFSSDLAKREEIVKRDRKGTFRFFRGIALKSDAGTE